MEFVSDSALATPIDPSGRRVVLLFNPRAMQNNGFEYYADDITANTGFSRPTVVESCADPQATFDKLAAVLEDGDILDILSGDGVGNQAEQYVGTQGAADVTLMFSGDHGNARNAYKAAVQLPYDGRHSTLLNIGTERTLYPLRASVCEPEGSYQHLALSIISIGAIATGAQVLETKWHRNNPLRRWEKTRYPYEQFVSISQALPRLRTLEVADTVGGNERLALDLIAAHAPCIGKAAIFRDIQMTDPAFLWGNIPDNLPWHTVPAMRQLLKGTLPVERIESGQNVAFSLTNSRRNRKARIQFDGQGRPLAMGSQVVIDQPDPRDATHRPIKAVTLL